MSSFVLSSSLQAVGPIVEVEVLEVMAAYFTSPAVVDEVGLFRVSGALSPEFFSSLCAGQPRLADPSLCPHSAATIFKKYIRMSDPPLIPFEFYAPLLLAHQSATPSDRLARMKQTIQDFPDSTKMRLEILIPMLRTIIEHSDKNQMYVQQTSFFFHQLFRTFF